MGKYQGYPEYKETHLEWLREIPNHWEIKRLKYLGDAIIGLTYSPDDVVDSEDEGTLVLRSSNVQNRALAFDDNVFVNKPIPEHLKTRKGDILICARNGSRALIGKNAQIDERAEGMTFGAFMSVFRSPYNDYLSKVFNSALFEYQSGTFLTATINQLTTANLNSFEVPLPPESERQTIANFLDHETAKIDTLIEKQQQLIKLLKEKRQAVISHAVTKGLNPEVLMKDSGVEWLGEVPEHWEVKRLKNCLLAPMRNGLFKKKDQFGSGSLLVNVGDLYIPDNFISPSSLERVVTTKEEQQTYKVSSGDIFFVRSSLKLEGIGRSACFLEEKDDVVFECHIVNARPDKGQISPKYLTRYLNSELVSQEFIKRSKTTTMTTIDQGALSSITVLVPPLEEQLNVDAFLDKELGAIQIAVEKSELAIKLLTERRTAIISSAVTGKIDVRYWQAPTSQDQTLEHTA